MTGSTRGCHELIPGSDGQVVRGGKAARPSLYDEQLRERGLKAIG